MGETAATRAQIYAVAVLTIVLLAGGVVVAAALGDFSAESVSLDVHLVSPLESEWTSTGVRPLADAKSPLVD